MKCRGWCGVSKKVYTYSASSGLKAIIFGSYWPIIIKPEIIDPLCLAPKVQVQETVGRLVTPVGTIVQQPALFRWPRVPPVFQNAGKVFTSGYYKHPHNHGINGIRHILQPHKQLLKTLSFKIVGKVITSDTTSTTIIPRYGELFG